MSFLPYGYSWFVLREKGFEGSTQELQIRGHSERNSIHDLRAMVIGNLARNMLAN